MTSTLSKRRSRRLKGKRIGRGFFNKLIDKLPIELHLPGYNFCGPGTKLEKRLKRGDRGVNPLDEACKKHDIAYTHSSDLKFRHGADKELYKAAKERIFSKDSSFGEKAASSAVAALMKAKVAIGMGVGKRSVRKKDRKLKRSKRGGALSFSEALKVARTAVAKTGTKNLLANVKAAYGTLKSKRRKIAEPRGRIIRIPKKGGFLPLVPLFAALGALGSLGGGAAAIAKTVTDAKLAKERLEEDQRHNRALEAKSVGSGFYIKPYKKGCGLYVDRKEASVAGRGFYIKPYKKGCGITNNSKN